jgi:hypothetical protein
VLDAGLRAAKLGAAFDFCNAQRWSDASSPCTNARSVRWSGQRSGASESTVVATHAVHPVRPPAAPVGSGKPTDRTRSERQHVHVPKRRREPRPVSRVAGRNQGLLDLQREGNDERVDGMRRGELDAGKEVTRTLGDRPREIRHPDSATVHDPIHGRVATRVAADFREDRHGNAHERPALVRDGQDGSGATAERAAAIRKDKGMSGLCVEDQRLGHARRALRSCSRDTGPSVRSSSPRNSPSCSGSSS